MSVRRLPSGDIFFPRRGSIPECPTGYVRDAGDPWLFHPVLNGCKYRSDKVDKACNCGKMVLWCTRDNIQIVRSRCVSCEENRDGVQA